MTSSADTIRITVRLHSILRHRHNQVTGRLEVQLPPGGKVKDVLRLLEIPQRPELVMALNGQEVEADAALAEGDVLALIPAVAGGWG